MGLENDNASMPLVFFLFAVFCAYWAQNTDHNAWLWLFLGLFFAPVAGFALLVRNSGDLRESKRILGD